MSNTAQLWKLQTRQPLGPPLQLGAAVTAVAFSPDGETMIVAAESVQAFATTAGLKNGRALFPEPALSLTFDREGKRLVVGTSGHQAHVLTVKTGKPEAVLQHRGPVESAGYLPGGSLVTGSSGALRIWQPGGISAWRVLQHENPISAVALSPRGDHCATATRSRNRATLEEGGAVQLWECASGRPFSSERSISDPVVELELHPRDATVLIAAGTAAQLLDTGTGERVGLRMEHADRVRIACLSRDGSIAVTGGGRKIRLWEVPSGKPVGPVLQPPDGNEIQAVAISPDGERVLAGSDNGVAWLWLWRSGDHPQPQFSLNHAGAILDLAFSPDGSTVATASSDHTARAWNAATGEPLAASFDHGDAVNALAFFSSDRFLITGTEDGDVHIWDIPTGTVIYRVLAHTGAVRSISFDAPSHTLLTGGDDRCARLWNFGPIVSPKPKWAVLWAEAFSGMELDANDETRQLEPGAWRDRKARLARLLDENAGDVLTDKP